MIDAWQLIDTEYIVDNRWIRFSKRKFLLPNGSVIPDYYIVEKPDVVLVVAITPERQTMIMKEFERGVMETGYKFPAGRTNASEKPEDAAKREFYEETGIMVNDLISAGVLHADPGWLTTKVHVFVAHVPLMTAQDILQNPHELFETEWIDFHLLGKLIDSGEVHNIFVVSAYHLAEKYVK